MGANQFNGATKGNSVSNGNLYLFRFGRNLLYFALRLSSTKVTRIGAAEDVNVVRRRANAKKDVYYCNYR